MQLSKISKPRDIGTVGPYPEEVKLDGRKCVLQRSVEHDLKQVTISSTSPSTSLTFDEHFVDTFKVEQDRKISSISPNFKKEKY